MTILEQYRADGTGPTLARKLATVRCLDELAGFETGLARSGDLDAVARAEIERRRCELSAKHSPRKRRA